MSTCIHCRAMAEEIAALRATLGLSGHVAVRRSLQRAYLFTPQQARLAQALYEAGGKVVPRETLDDLVLSEAAYADGSDALKVIACKGRRALGPDTIDYALGGYAMTQEGRALISTALKVAA